MITKPLTQTLVAQLVATLIFPLFVSQATSAQSYVAPLRPEEYPAFFNEGTLGTNEKLVEQIISTKLENWVIPVESGAANSKASGGRQMVHVLEAITKEAKGVSNQAKPEFIIGPKLIQSQVGEIYAEVYKRKQDDPKKPVEQVLREIAKQAASPTAAAIYSKDLVGGDVKNLIYVHGLSDSQLQELNRRLSSFTFQGANNPIASQLGEVQPVEKFIQTLDQGGTDLQALTFNLSNHHIQSPSQLPIDADDRERMHFLRNYEGAVARVFRGDVQYHPKYGARETKNYPGIVNAVWAVTSLPYIYKVSDVNHALQKALENDVGHPEIAGRAMENALQGPLGAGNKVFHESKDPLLKQLHELVTDTLSLQPGQLASHAPFGHTEIAKELKAYLKPLPSTIYMPTRGLDHIDDVVRYGVGPGTSIRSSQASNLLRSKLGLEVSPTAASARELAKQTGKTSVVLPLPAQQNAKYLDWSRLPEEYRLGINDEARKAGMDRNLFLFERYGVQAVGEAGHLTIMDASAIANHSVSIADITRGHLDYLRSLDSHALTFSDVAEAKRLVGRLQLEQGSRATADLEQSVHLDQLLSDSFGREPVRDVGSLAKLDSVNLPSSVRKSVDAKMGSGDFVQAVAKDLRSHFPGHPEYVAASLEAMPSELRTAVISSVNEAPKKTFSDEAFTFYTKVSVAEIDANRAITSGGSGLTGQSTTPAALSKESYAPAPSKLLSQFGQQPLEDLISFQVISRDLPPTTEIKIDNRIGAAMTDQTFVQLQESLSRSGPEDFLQKFFALPDSVQESIATNPVSQRQILGDLAGGAGDGVENVSRFLEISPEVGKIVATNVIAENPAIIANRVELGSADGGYLAESMSGPKKETARKGVDDSSGKLDFRDGKVCEIRRGVCNPLSDEMQKLLRVESGKKLSDAQRELFRKWLGQGGAGIENLPLEARKAAVRYGASIVIYQTAKEQDYLRLHGESLKSFVQKNLALVDPKSFSNEKFVGFVSERTINEFRASQSRPAENVQSTAETGESKKKVDTEPKKEQTKQQRAEQAVKENLTEADLELRKRLLCK